MYYTITQEGAALVIEDNNFYIHKDDPRWEDVLSLIAKGDEPGLLYLLDRAKPVQSYISESGDFTISDGIVYYKDEPVENELVNLIVNNMEYNIPFEHLVKFYEKLQTNPSYRSREQLWNFITKMEFPICSDGDFIAWKGVDTDRWDLHSHTVQYLDGETYRMDRSQVSDDPKDACAPGLHIGTQSYAGSWGPTVIACKINPRDVVRVPYDHSYEKCAVCKLKVISEVGFIKY